MQGCTTIEEVQQFVRDAESVWVRGGGTKSVLSRGANLELSALEGVIQYDPGEFTIQARAGTPLSVLNQVLAEHQQYLPFDPPWSAAGATLGGTVAAGISGAGRYRYGGVRDFLLGVTLVTGDGQLVKGGGQVVKNAAGLDLPKLMVGSWGRLGVLCELTLKVFPAPEATATLQVTTDSPTSALKLLHRLYTSPLDLACLEWDPPHQLWVRLAGLAESLPARLERLATTLQGRVERWDKAQQERQIWADRGEFDWLPDGAWLVKIPTTISRLAELEDAWRNLEAVIPRRYSVGGNLCWLAWPQEQGLPRLAGVLQELGCQAVVVRGPAPTNGWQQPSLDPLSERLRTVLDPHQKLQPDSKIR